MGAPQHAARQVFQCHPCSAILETRNTPAPMKLKGNRIMDITATPARPKAPTPASMLRLAEAVPETAENFPVLRELRKALETLVKIADEVAA